MCIVAICCPPFGSGVLTWPNVYCIILCSDTYAIFGLNIFCSMTHRKWIGLSKAKSHTALSKLQSTHERKFTQSEGLRLRFVLFNKPLVSVRTFTIMCDHTLFYISKQPNRTSGLK